MSSKAGTSVSSTREQIYQTFGQLGRGQVSSDLHGEAHVMAHHPFMYSKSLLEQHLASLHVVNLEVYCIITMVTTLSLQERCSLLQSVY